MKIATYLLINHLDFEVDLSHEVMEVLQILSKQFIVSL